MPISNNVQRTTATEGNISIESTIEATRTRLFTRGKRMTELMNQVNKLKLFGMKESIDYRLVEAVKARHGYQDLLTLLLEDESLYRENRRSDSLRKRAKFKDRATLEEFDVSVGRGVNKGMLKQLQTLRFMDDKENIILVGGTGAGKSFLA